MSVRRRPRCMSQGVLEVERHSRRHSGAHLVFLPSIRKGSLRLRSPSGMLLGPKPAAGASQTRITFPRQAFCQPPVLCGAETLVRTRTACLDCSHCFESCASKGDAKPSRCFTM